MGEEISLTSNLGVKDFSRARIVVALNRGGFAMGYETAAATFSRTGAGSIPRMVERCPVSRR
jgi:hypothetical protein